VDAEPKQQRRRAAAEIVEANSLEPCAKKRLDGVPRRFRMADFRTKDRP
jgi:hypothetical protein